MGAGSRCSSHLCFLSFLGGQDLREECIKLKKRVFDLERQNQVLSTLLQQKLQLTANSLPQVGRAFSCGPQQHCPSVHPIGAGCQLSSTQGLWPYGEGILGLTDLHVS